MRNLLKINEQVLILVARGCFAVARYIVHYLRKVIFCFDIAVRHRLQSHARACVCSYFIQFFLSVLMDFDLYISIYICFVPLCTCTFDVKCRRFHCLFDGCVYNYHQSTRTNCMLSIPSPCQCSRKKKRHVFISHPIFLVHKLKALSVIAHTHTVIHI